MKSTDEPERVGALALKDVNGEWVRRWVDYDTYIYVRQLEFAIRHGKSNGIKKLYPERFCGK